MPREVVRVPGLPVPDRPYAPAVRAGPFVVTSGQLATDFRSGLVQEARPPSSNSFFAAIPEKIELRHTFRQLGQVLEAAGSSLDLCAFFRVFVASYPRYAEDVEGPDPHYERWRATVDSFLAVRDEFIARDRPASSTLPIRRLIARGPRAVTTAIAVTRAAGWERSAHAGPDGVPKPLGGYSPAIRVGPWLFLAGKTPTDYRVGIPPEARARPWQWYTNEVRNQARYILTNLKKTVEGCGTRWDDVVATTVYLRDLAQLPALEEVWREFFPAAPPARTIVPVLGTGIRPGPGEWAAGLEIDVVAIYPGDGVRKEIVQVPPLETPIGHASHAVRAGGLTFISGRCAANADGLLPACRQNPDLPYLSSGSLAQTRRIVAEVGTICEAAGGSLDDVILVERYLPDLRELELSSLALTEAFGDSPPATTEVEVPGCLPIPEAAVMASALAYIPG